MGAQNRDLGPDKRGSHTSSCARHIENCELHSRCSSRSGSQDWRCASGRAGVDRSEPRTTAIGSQNAMSASRSAILVAIWRPDGDRCLGLGPRLEGGLLDARGDLVDLVEGLALLTHLV